jgi:hypothetical protein
LFLRGLPDNPYMKLLITWLLIWPLGLAWAQVAPTPEPSVKAVFIYNFTRFVDWPEEAFSGPSAPFIIGIVGEDPLGAVLLETVAGEKVGNHPIRVQHVQLASELKECHLLYINLKDAKQLTQTLALMNQRPVLTVGEAPTFSRQGGMIRFQTRNNKIRLEINPVALRAAQLGISSKLLQVADIVNE